MTTHQLYRVEYNNDFGKFSKICVKPINRDLSRGVTCYDRSTTNVAILVHDEIFATNELYLSTSLCATLGVDVSYLEASYKLGRAKFFFFDVIFDEVSTRTCRNSREQAVVDRNQAILAELLKLL